MTTVFCVHGGRVVNCSGVLGYIAGDGVHRVVNGDMGGGRTVVTVQDIFHGVFFFASLLASILAWAVGPSLIVVGVMMVRFVIG